LLLHVCFLSLSRLGGSLRGDILRLLGKD